MLKLHDYLLDNNLIPNCSSIEQHSSFNRDFISSGYQWHSSEQDYDSEYLAIKINI